MIRTLASRSRPAQWLARSPRWAAPRPTRSASCGGRRAYTSRRPGELSIVATCSSVTTPLTTSGRSGPPTTAAADPVRTRSASDAEPDLLRNRGSATARGSPGSCHSRRRALSGRRRWPGNARTSAACSVRSAGSLWSCSPGQSVFLAVYCSIRSMRCAAVGRNGLAIILAIRCNPDMAQMPAMTADRTPRDAQDVLVGTGQQTFIRGWWVRGAGSPGGRSGAGGCCG